MKKLIILTLLTIAINGYAQNYLLKPGDKFPNITIEPLINSPFQTLNINADHSEKLFIVNFWGTWCSPCIPEMDSLAKLQAKFGNRIQVVGLSNDPIIRLEKYITQRPSHIWLASDSTLLLYRMLDLASVGQCLIIDKSHQIVALLRTDSVNESIINKLLINQKVKSNGDLKGSKQICQNDIFGVDSLLSNNFTIRGYMDGQGSMSKIPTTGVFAGRRITFFNVGLGMLLGAAYNISSPKQIIFQGLDKKYDDYANRQFLYCFDLLVNPEQKDSLYIIMQKKLQENLPVEVRVEMRDADVYVLKLEGSNFYLPKSKGDKPTYSFSGNGFDGTGITLEEFASYYLSNELDLPVVNETGLAGDYDIKTNVDLRNKGAILKSIHDIGLTVKKERRKVRTLIICQKNFKS